MKRHFILSFALTLALGTPALAAQFDMTMTASSMENHPVIANSLLPMQKMIAEKTKGQISVTFFNPGTICPEPEILPTISKGIVDMGFSSAGRFPQKYTTTLVAELPFFSPNSRITAAALAHYLDQSQELQDEYAEFKVLTLTGSTPRDILSIKPIRSLEDLKGKKIGTTNATGSEALTLLGATPVIMPNNEMYMNLQRGMVDAVFMPIPTYRSLKISEVAKYLTRCSIAPSTTPCLLNKKRYESFTPEIKAEYDALYVKPASFHAALWVDKSTNDDLQWIIDNHNVQVIELDPVEQARWTKSLEPLVDSWKEKMLNKGLNPDKVIAEVQALVDYYSENDMENWKKEYESYKDILGSLYTPLDF